MNMLFIIPDPAANPGDTIIRHGVIELLGSCLGSCSPDYYYFESDRPELVEHNAAILQKDYDLLVVCGTPWLWDHCISSRKYRELQGLLSAFASATKIALGIGACLPFGETSKLLCRDQATVAGLQNVWEQFALITTRDRLAATILRKCGIPHHSDFCPSVLAVAHHDRQGASYVHAGGKRKGGLVFYTPQHGISRTVLPREFVRQYLEMQISLARNHDLEVACLLPHERDYLADIFPDRDIAILDRAEKIIAFVANRETVITGRVHVAIPAFLAGAATFLLPVDSRYRTAAELGIPILWRYKTFFPIGRLRPRLFLSLLGSMRLTDLLLSPGTKPASQSLDLEAYRERHRRLFAKIQQQGPPNIASNS